MTLNCEIAHEEKKKPEKRLPTLISLRCNSSFEGFFYSFLFSILGHLQIGANQRWHRESKSKEQNEKNNKFGFNFDEIQKKKKERKLKTMNTSNLLGCWLVNCRDNDFEIRTVK